MTEVQVDGRIQTPREVRAIFCHVVQGRKFKENGKDVGDIRYDATFILSLDDLKAITSKAIAVARARWPMRDMKELRWPWATKDKFVEDAGKRAAKKGGDAAAVAAAREKAAKTVPDGHYVLKAGSKFEVQLAVLDGRKILELQGPQRASVGRSRFYAGGYYVPQVNFVSYVGKKIDDPDGVTAYLDSMLFVKDGEKLAGAPSAAEAFKGYVGTITDENPIAGNQLDDKIPF